MNWYVILEDNGHFKPWNVFNNRRFKEAIDTDVFAVPELSRDEVSELLRRFAQWQFWSRCEYEMLLYPWPKGDRDCGYKIDVFEQLELNWEHFVDYVYGCYCFGEEDNG